MPMFGLEPKTCWLQISCSANWATSAHIAKAIRWDLQGSNLWPSACKADALPAELRSHTTINLKRPRTDSNRRPPPWQGGALTNWATGPYHIAKRYDAKKHEVFLRWTGGSLTNTIRYQNTKCLRGKAIRLVPSKPILKTISFYL